MQLGETMAENKPTSKITHIIFDLDGLILGELEKLVQSFIKMFFFSSVW